MRESKSSFFSLDSVKALARERAEALGKLPISLSPEEGTLLRFFVRHMRCKTFVEVGTLTGHSALWILEGLGEGGILYTIERDPICFQESQRIFDRLHSDSDFQRSGAEVHLIGEDAVVALQSLPKTPLDGIFIDANKSAYPTYLNWAESHLKIPGGLMLADNTHMGRVLDQEVDRVMGGRGGSRGSGFYSPGVREFLDQVQGSPLWDSICLSTPGGLMVALRLECSS